VKGGKGCVFQETNWGRRGGRNINVWRPVDRKAKGKRKRVHGRAGARKNGSYVQGSIKKGRAKITSRPKSTERHRKKKPRVGPASSNTGLKESGGEVSSDRGRRRKRVSRPSVKRAIKTLTVYCERIGDTRSWRRKKKSKFSRHRERRKEKEGSSPAKLSGKA